MRMTKIGKVGFIGLGTMGWRMATRLREAGYDLLAYNRTLAKRELFAAEGGQVANSVAEVSRQAEVLFSSLSMPKDVEEVYLGGDGILAHVQPGTICVDLTTVGLDTSRKVYKEATERGVSYLDAPVSGGPEGAEAGTLTIMVGGDKKAFEQVQPLLSVLGKNVQHLGESGLGSAAKLFNQYLVAVHSLAAAEVMAGAAKLGMDQKQLYNLLRTSYGYSKMLERHLEQFVFMDNFEPGGAMKYLLKDLRLSNRLIAEAGVEPGSGKVAEKVLESALNDGWGEKDMSGIIRWVEEKWK